MPTVTRLLTVAGSDPAGGAGLQLDLKVFAALGGDGAAVPAVLTAQGAAGLERVDLVAGEAVEAALRCVFENPPDAAKTGALGGAAAVAAVAAVFAVHPRIPLVVDPVGAPSRSAHAGLRLLAEDAAHALRSLLLPLAHVLTPNLAEAAALLALPGPAQDRAAMLVHARGLLDSGARAVLLKGGHLGEPGASPDLLCTADGVVIWLEGPRLPDAGGVHGTGCALSAALCAHLGAGLPLPAAAAAAKADLAGWLRAAVGGRLVPVPPPSGR
ncbi:MAG TPA: bifunctional hydroxymethylpyrimidine kinase/phosphomethylpyrimidine kinase [Planctomycetota bacterium]